MTLIKICMLALMGITMTMVIKQWKSDFLPLIRVGLLLLFVAVLLTTATPIFDYLRELTNTEGISEHASLLFRGLGIALLTQIASQICRECGESGIADGVELTGKIELLLLCIPLMNEILELSKELLSTGG
ncbi:MAG: hypothetical protein IJX80_09425 [Clostridia bacterium]|nr:hypothetical protein [Clostridia bacterium]